MGYLEKSSCFWNRIFKSNMICMHGYQYHGWFVYKQPLQMILLWTSETKLVSAHSNAYSMCNPTNMEYKWFTHWGLKLPNNNFKINPREITWLDLVKCYLSGSFLTLLLLVKGFIKECQNGLSNLLPCSSSDWVASCGPSTETIYKHFISYNFGNFR